MHKKMSLKKFSFEKIFRLILAFWQGQVESNHR